MDAAELRNYYALLREPDVVFLHEVLSRYSKGSAKGISAVATDGLQAQKTDGLRNFDKAYFKSKFTLVQVARFPGGGRVISIIFVDKPDRMFDCWVFKTLDAGYELRAFTHDTSFEAKEIQVVYRNILQDPKARL